MNLCNILFKYFRNQVNYSVFLNTKVGSEFKFCHLMNFDSSHNTDDLIKSCLIFCDWLFNTKLSVYDTTFKIFFYFFQKSWKEIWILVTYFKQTFIAFRGQLFEMFQKFNIKSILYVIMNDGSYKMWKDIISQLQTCRL